MAGKGTIGAKLVLEGESEYRAALKNIKSAQSELRSEMKLCASEFKTSQNSMSALQSKYDILGRQVEQAQKKYDVFADALSEAKSKQNELGTALSQAQSKYDAATKALESMKDSADVSNEELEEQQKLVNQCAQEVNNAQSKYDACTKKVTDYQTSLNYAGAELADFKTDQAQTAKYLDEAEKNVDNCATSINEYGQEVVEATEETSTFGSVLSANLASEAIIKGVEALVSGIKTVASACIDTGMAFEKSMSTVEALSGATGKDLEDLTNKAREMGAATLYSAADAADALGYMALAGWDTQQMLAGIEPVMNLAIASNMDLAEASDIVTDYITAFGLTVDDSAKFVDEMAYAMANSNTNTEQLGEAYKNCAATAGSMGFSVEETTAALMVMADAGQKGGEAGTGLNTIMTRLATNTSNCADELAKYGVEIYDEQGSMNSLSSIIIGCADAWGGLSDEEQNALAKSIAGTNQFNKFKTVMIGMNDAAKASGKSFEDYAKQLEECDGTAQKMADTMADNLQGALWNLESGLEAVEETAYSALSDSLKQGVEEAADALTRLDNSMKSGDTQVALARLGESLGEFIENAADLTTAVMPAFIDALTWVIDNASLLAGGITGITTAITAYKVATTAAEIATTAFSLALPTGQIALAASLLTGAATALGIWGATAGQSKSEISELAADTQSLADSLQSSAANREADRKSMQSSAEQAKRLVAELENENTTTKRKKQIVDELNQVMPQLNLSYDETTDSLNMSTDALEDNIDALIRQSKAAAAQEDLAEISKEMYDAEMALNDIMQEVADKYGLTADNATELANAVQDAAMKVGNYEGTIELLNEGNEKLANLTINDAEAMYDLGDSLLDAQAQYDSLASEYETVNGYIEDNTAKVDENTDAVTINGETVQEVSEELQKAYDKAYESIQKSLSSASDDFQELGQQALGVSEATTTSFDDIQQSVEEWAAGVNTYADSVAEAEQIMSADSNTTAYLQSIIDKGPSAKAELDAITDAYDNNKESFDELVETYNQASTMLDSLAEMEAGFSTGYEAMYEAGLEAITDGNETNTEAITQGLEDQLQVVTDKTAELSEAMSEGYTAGTEDQIDTVSEATTQLVEEGILNPIDEGLGTEGESTSTKTTTIGEAVDQGLIDGMVNNQPLVITQAQMMCAEVYSTFETELSSDKFVTIGEQICQGLVSGIENGADWIKEAAKKAAKEAFEAAKKELDVNSPSRKFRWLGEMSGEGYMNGLVESMNGVDKVIANAMPDSSGSSGGVIKGSAKLGTTVNQTVNIYAKTDNIIDTARQFKQSQREAANAW